MIISLVGFMGTGKSSIGSLLARRLGLDFIDTDEKIQEIEGRSIERIFATNGELYFRSLEKKVLKKLIAENENLVLATGGGIVLDRENRELIKNKTRPILLTAPPEVIYQRVKDSGRPLLQGNDSFNKIKVLLAEREDYYREFKPEIKTGGKGREEIVEEILLMIGDGLYEDNHT